MSGLGREPVSRLGALSRLPQSLLPRHLKSHHVAVWIDRNDEPDGHPWVIDNGGAGPRPQLQWKDLRNRKVRTQENYEIVALEPEPVGLAGPAALQLVKVYAGARWGLPTSSDEKLTNVGPSQGDLVECAMRLPAQ